jgi:tungstate transport system ATP-binding protein
MQGLISDLPIRIVRASVRAGGTALIDDVTLSISSGPPTVLMGPNGCGKTTLIKLCMGLLASTVGHVQWGEHNEGPMHCAMMFQRPVMLRRSAAANVEYALSGAERGPARVLKLLRNVGLEELADRPARRLSGGEQQRLALARALARNPEVLFLDEPTSSLDPASTLAVEEIVRAVDRSGIKVVMSTHDIGQAKRLAGDVAFLVHGRLVEHRPAAEFFERPLTPQAAAFVRGELVI